MATALVGLLEDNIAEGAAPNMWRMRDVHGKTRKADLDAGLPALEIRHEHGAGADAGCMRAEELVVEPPAGGRAGRAEPVDRDPGAHLVVGPGVVVSPLAQLLVDPGEQTGGAVSEAVPQGLRARALDRVVPGPLGLEEFHAGEPCFLARGVRSQRVFQREEGVLSPGRGRGEVEVEVLRDGVVGVPQGEGTRDEPAPVAALDGVPLVAESQHQLVHDLGLVLDREPALPGSLGEAEVDERGRDDVEGGLIPRPAALRKRRDDLRALVETARPAMQVEQGHGGVLVGAAPLVDEVHGQGLEAVGLQIRGEVGEFVEAGLGLPPVEGLGPVFGKTLGLGEGHAVLPARIFELVRVPHAGEALFQIR